MKIAVELRPEVGELEIGVIADGWGREAVEEAREWIVASVVKMLGSRLEDWVVVEMKTRVVAEGSGSGGVGSQVLLRRAG